MNPEDKICSSRKLCSDIHCKECYEKSFASSDKVKYWSKQNNKNPRDIFKFSNVKYIFDCGDCGHQFESILNNILNGHWCPYCSHRKLCSNDCDSCYQKSFASSDKAIYWSNQNNLTSRQVFKSSRTNFIFNCNCGHNFESTLHNISKGSGVHIVLIENYVQVIVIHVIKNHLQVLIKLSIGVKKILRTQEKFLNLPVINLYLIVIVDTNSNLLLLILVIIAGVHIVRTENYV